MTIPIIIILMSIIVAQFIVLRALWQELRRIGDGYLLVSKKAVDRGDSLILNGEVVFERVKEPVDAEWPSEIGG